MYKLNKNFFFSALEFLFFLIAIYLWSTKLYLEWGTDFGIYYSGSFFTSTIFNSENDYKIYSEFFTHKGPIYYLFLKIIGNIIGWGHHQAVFSLYLSVLVFFITIYFFIKKKVTNNTLAFFLILLSLLLLVGQPTNSSIAFFQMGLILISFIFLIYSEKNRGYIHLSLIFLNLAIFTRIDFIIFIFPFLVFMGIQIYKKKFSTIKIFVFYFVLFPIILISLLKFFFIFSIFDFYNHNFKFNLWYKNIFFETNSIIKYLFIKFHREVQFSIITKSFLLPIFIFILGLILKKKIDLKNSYSEISKKIKFESNDFVIASILLSGILIVFNSFDKQYHLLSISVPILFFIIYYSQAISQFKIIQILFIPFFIYSYVLEFDFIIGDFKKKLNCLNNIFCEYSDLHNYQTTINSIKQIRNNEVHIIGGRGWVYFFSTKKPHQSLNDWWFYYGNKGFETKSLLKSFDSLVNQEKGYKFWVDNRILERAKFNQSEKIKKVLKKSQIIVNQGRHSMLQLK